MAGSCRHLMVYRAVSMYLLLVLYITVFRIMGKGRYIYFNKFYYNFLKDQVDPMVTYLPVFLVCN